MSEAAAIGHNNPPPPTLAELVSSATIDKIISAELDREPVSPDGTKIKSIRERDPELEAMCRRFLADHPKITTEEGQRIADAVLSTCLKFSGGKGRVESARAALKKPVWDAGVTIDQTFAKYGIQLTVRPLAGPVKDRRAPPYTLAEQIVMRVTAYKDDQDRQIRAKAQEAVDKAAEARLAEKLATSGRGLVTMLDAAHAAARAEEQQAIVNAPAAALTKSSGGDFGSTSRKRIRTFRIADAALVPRHLCVPSEALIREAIGKAGGPMPVIPGVVIEDVSDLTRR